MNRRKVLSVLGLGWLPFCFDGIPVLGDNKKKVNVTSLADQIEDDYAQQVVDRFIEKYERFKKEDRVGKLMQRYKSYTFKPINMAMYIDSEMFKQGKMGMVGLLSIEEPPQCYWETIPNYPYYDSKYIPQTECTASFDMSLRYARKHGIVLERIHNKIASKTCDYFSRINPEFQISHVSGGIL